MSVRHTVRKNDKGDTITVKLTPLKAIRWQCLECCVFQPKEVRLCSSPLCALYPFRLGKDPSLRGRAGPSAEAREKGQAAMRKIRKKQVEDDDKTTPESTRGDKCIPKVG
uniref:Uncharacterized protein n=1 Tax=viral metagenome TaxID=1070528 RepID=A0A6M3XWM9_9ZZZZ